LASRNGIEVVVNAALSPVATARTTDSVRRTTMAKKKAAKKKATKKKAAKKK